MSLLRGILFLFDPREKRKLAVMFAMMIFGAALETVGLGLLVPFVALIGNPAWVEKYRALTWLRAASGIQTHEGFVLAFGIGIALIYVFKNSYIALMTYSQNKFLFNKQVQLSRLLLSTYLRRPYTFHLQKNSAELFVNISCIGTILHGVLIPLFAVVIEAIVVIFIVAALFGVAPKSALFCVLLLAAPTIGFYVALRKKLKLLGAQKEVLSTQMVKWLNQSFGGIKETKILGREKFFLDAYTSNATKYADASCYAQTMSLMPRLFVETIAILGLVSLVCFVIWQKSDLQSLLPTLGVFTLAIGRLMPSTSRIVGHFTVFKHCSSVVEKVVADLRDVRSDAAQLESDANGADRFQFHLRQAIELKNISYSYENAKRPALQSVSLSLEKGQSIGIIGPSGAGKTTLVDLILGLLSPSAGSILVDGVDVAKHISAWQRRIGYVPQNIYLSDDTLRRNIAFGVPDAEIDETRVRNAVKAAQLDDYVRGLPEGMNTMAGERGVRMSGGQRQRIGIARALYHDPDLLILDEATSALDHDTEKEVTRAIESLRGSRTIIVIAHRLTTIQKCNRLYKIVDGKVVAQGPYHELQLHGSIEGEAQ